MIVLNKYIMIVKVCKSTLIILCGLFFITDSNISTIKPSVLSWILTQYTHVHMHAQKWHLLESWKRSTVWSGRLTNEGVGQSAPQGTLSVSRASVLGAVDHNLSVDPCGSGPRCCGGSGRKLRALSRNQSVLFFAKRQWNSRGTEKKLERAGDSVACKEPASSTGDSQPPELWEQCSEFSLLVCIDMQKSEVKLERTVSLKS